MGQLPTVMSTPPRADWVNPTGKAMGNFIVAVDPQGQLAYSGLSIEKKGRPAAHVIEALTEQVAPEYLSYLQNQGVSYLFAGEERLNCTLLLEKLHRLFGINKLMLAGGGIVNGSFLAENLVDELSIVIAPVADGGTVSVPLPKLIFCHPGHRLHFILKRCRQLYRMCYGCATPGHKRAYSSNQ